MIKLAGLLAPYRIQIALILVLTMLQALANLYLPSLMAGIVDTGIVRGDTSYIITVGAWMLLITIAGTICAVISRFSSARVATGFGRIVRGKLFSQVQQFSLQEFDEVSTASLITRTTNDTTQVQQVLIMMLNMMTMAPLMGIGGVIMAVYQDAKLAWILAAVVPMIALLLGLVMSRATPLFRSMQAKIDRLNLVLDEGMTGVRVIRAFDRTAYEKERFDQANVDVTQTALRVNRLVAISMPALSLMINLATLAIVWFGGLLIDSGETQVGSVMAFLQYAMQIMAAVMMVTMMFVMLPRASASASRINEVLAMKPTVKDPPEGARFDAKRGLVEFRQVTFCHVGAEEPALCDVSFQARPGQTTAIIGGTGSGKSTLISLIPRFYDVASGSVLVDGVDVRHVIQDELRAKIGIVPQKAVLFSGTVAENIRYGKKEASDEEVRQAAETAQATEFIVELEDGFDSQIAQGGTNLSGGQKQRLAIARALVRKPEIYIFDDSFSALDFTTDARLRAELKRETGDATVIIVAQRVGTIMDADQIIVLDEGRVAGTGTHRELMESCDVYYEIVASQLSLEEVA